MRQRASRILPGGLFGRGWLSALPEWGCQVTGTATLLALVTPEHCDPDAVLMMLLDSVQEEPSVALCTEIARRLTVRGCPRDVVLLWVWCAAAVGDQLSQRRIAKALFAEAASAEPRIDPDAAASFAASWMGLGGDRPWSRMFERASGDPLPVPHFEAIAVAGASPHLI